MTEPMQEFNDQADPLENLAANESQLTANRRNYPKNMKGGKEEWLGIEHHQNEINQELNALEKNIKDLKKNDLRSKKFNFQFEIIFCSANYNSKIIDQLEQRQAYLENKKVEGQVMNVKGQEYKEEMKKMRQDRDDFRAFMKQVYDYNVSEKQQNKKNEVIYSLFFNSYTIIYFLGSWSKN